MTIQTLETRGIIEAYIRPADKSARGDEHLEVSNMVGNTDDAEISTLSFGIRNLPVKDAMGKVSTASEISVPVGLEIKR